MKKRILSILTVTAMLLSMCAVSVYAADPIDLTGITQPVTYNYTVSTVDTFSVFAPTDDVYGKDKAEVKGVTGTASNASATKEVTFVEDGDNKTAKTVTTGQKIKVSLKAAGNTWRTKANKVYVGVFGHKNNATDSNNKNNFYVVMNNASGEITKIGAVEWDDEKYTYNTIETPNEDWVHYDLVIEVCSDKNLVSLYADGQEVFAGVPTGLDAYTSVSRPNVRVALPAKAAGQEIYLSDISMTIYPANYEGTIVEENPLKLTDDFVREGDGAILYKGMKLLSNADEELVTKIGWTAQYLSDGYIRIKKGDEDYYYEKASDRIENFNLNSMTIAPGKKEWTVSVRNIEEDAINPTLFLASYSGENMVKIARSENVTIAPGETKDLKVTLEVGENENVDKIRIFLFNSSGSLVPLKNARGTTKAE